MAISYNAGDNNSSWLGGTIINGRSSQNNYGFYIGVRETYVSGGSDNYSNIDIQIGIKNNGARFSTNGWCFKYTVDGVVYDYQTGVNIGTNYAGFYDDVRPITIDNSNNRGMYVKNIPHGNDGSKTVHIKVEMYNSTYGSYTPGYCVAEGDFPLTKIARYATVTNSYSNLQETSVKVSWSSDAAVKKVQYRLNGGSWVTVENNVNKTSGNYTITGLNANTNYTIDCDYQRRDSDMYSYSAGKSNSLSVKTYQYPYVDSATVSSLIVGNQQQLKIYNPLGRSLTVYMKQNNTSGTTLYSGSTSSSGNEITFTFTPNSTTLANSIPDNIKGNAVYYCVYSNHTVQTKSGTYYLVESEIKPTFDVSDWSYTANYTSLTNDNQKVIKGWATVTVSVNTSASAYTGASISRYKVEWGNKSDYINGSTGSVSITGGTEAILKVTAIDSREQTVETSINFGDNLIDYNEPILTGSTEREDGISTDTTLSINGTFFNNTFGSNGMQNDILYVSYAVSTDGVTYDNDNYIPLNYVTIRGNSFSITDYNIHLNGTSGGFPIGTRYYVKIGVADYLRIIEKSGIIITDGKIAVDCYQDNNGDYHRGINGLGDDNYTLYVHGNIHADNMPTGGGGETLPVGTEVDFDGNVSDIPTGWEQIDEYDVLYTGDSASGNITLSHNYSDYKRLEIIIVDRSSIPSVFTFFPSATHAGTNTWSNKVEVRTGDQERGDNTYYFYAFTTLSFSGTTVTRDYDKVFQVNNGVVTIGRSTSYYKLVIREIRGYK